MLHRSPTWLLDYKKDVHSQTGEDGIIEAILSAFEEHDKWCVEFGAWDGQCYCNARNLIENKSYRAVLIESDPDRYVTLKNFYRNNSGVIAINDTVGFDQRSGLDEILARTSITKDFDFCSIDIDGNDYHAWRAMTAYRPKIICIEFNPTIPNDCLFVQPADHAVSQGSSLSAMTELGKSKGYELVCVLQANAFFVRDDLFHLLEIRDNRPVTLRTDLSCITYLFQGFDGRIFIHGNSRLL